MSILTLIVLVVAGYIAWMINDRLPYAPKWIGQVIILALALIVALNVSGVGLGLNTRL